MKSTCVVFILQIWILNNLSSVPVLAESRVDATHGKCDTIEDEALESTTKRPNPIGIGLDRPASDGHSSGATHSLSINLDGTHALRFAQIEPEGAYVTTSERTESKVILDGGVEGHATVVNTGSLGANELEDHSEPSRVARIPLNHARSPLNVSPVDRGENIGKPRSEYQASPIQTPSIVEAFYSRNQQMLQTWTVPYGNSLFVRLDQPGFISPYFSLLRARNLIVP